MRQIIQTKEIPIVRKRTDQTSALWHVDTYHLPVLMSGRDFAGYALTFAGVVAALAALGIWSALPLALVLLGVLPLPALMLTSLKMRHGTQWVLASLLSLSLIGAALWLWFAPKVDDKPRVVISPSPLITVSPVSVTPPPESSTQITIAPPDGPVPRCVNVEGTAVVPPGATVWLTLHEPDDPDYYGFTRVTLDRANPGRWQARMELGGADGDTRRFLIHAFALGSEATALMDNLEIKGTYYFGPDALVNAKLATQEFDRKKGDVAPC